MLWGERVSVTTIDGLFTALLGLTVPLPKSLFEDNLETFLGIKVGADAEMVPRLRLAYVPTPSTRRPLNRCRGSVSPEYQQVSPTASIPYWRRSFSLRY